MKPKCTDPKPRNRKAVRYRSPSINLIRAVCRCGEVIERKGWEPWTHELSGVDCKTATMSNIKLGRLGP